MNELTGICPFGKIIFKKESKKVESGGLVIPESKNTCLEGVVLIAGTAPDKSDGVPEKGKVFVYSKNTAVEIEIDGIKYYQISYGDIRYFK